MGLSGHTFILLSELHWLMVHFISRHYYKRGRLLKSSDKVQLQLTSLTYPVTLLLMSITN